MAQYIPTLIVEISTLLEVQCTVDLIASKERPDAETTEDCFRFFFALYEGKKGSQESRENSSETKQYLVSLKTFEKTIDTFFFDHHAAASVRQIILQNSLKAYKTFLERTGALNILPGVEKVFCDFGHMTALEWKRTFEPLHVKTENSSHAFNINAEFLSAYQTLLTKSAQDIDNICSLERAFFFEITTERANMAQALAKLDKIHLLEMEQFEHQSNARTSNHYIKTSDSAISARLADIVNKHVAETELTQRHWNSRIKEIQERQKKRFVRFILDASKFGVFETLKSDKGETGSSKAAIEPFLSSCILLGDDHRKKLFDVELHFCDFSAFTYCKYEESDLEIRQNCLGNLFTDQMAAILIPHTSAAINTINSPGTSPIVSNFINDCDSVGEFLFPDIHHQLTEILQCSNNLEPGNVFVTRHSNLLSVHCAFHLICGSSKSTEIVIRGLEDVMRRIGKMGIERIAVPLVFSGHVSVDREMSEDMSKQIVSVMRAVKKGLIESSQHDILRQQNSALRTVQFFIPTHSSVSIADRFLNRIRAGLEEIFPTAFYS